MELGDKRRTARLVKLTERLAAQPQANLPVAAAGWAETKAACRLLSNDHLELLEILSGHVQNTEERAKAHPVVLCLQDTTELDFTSQPGIVGLGRLNYDARHGMYAHPTLMVTPNGLALGVVADMAERNPETHFVYVADREADIRGLIEEARRRGHAADYLIRAKHLYPVGTIEGLRPQAKNFGKMLHNKSRWAKLNSCSKRTGNERRVKSYKHSMPNAPR